MVRGGGDPWERGGQRWRHRSMTNYRKDRLVGEKEGIRLRADRVLAEVSEHARLLGLAELCNQEMLIVEGVI